MTVMLALVVRRLEAVEAQDAPAALGQREERGRAHCAAAEDEGVVGGQCGTGALCCVVLNHGQGCPCHD